MVMNLENLLLKSAMNQDYSEELKNVTEFYGSDLDKDLLDGLQNVFTQKFETHYS